MTAASPSAAGLLKGMHHRVLGSSQELPEETKGNAIVYQAWSRSALNHGGHCSNGISNP